MHVGLFGYSRQMNKISLPRAIPFCCALYSIGIPPELLGLSALSEKDLDLVRNIYHAFDEDITDSTKYLCKENLERLPGGVGQKIEEMLQNFDCRPDSQYSIYAKEVMDILLSADKSNLAEAIIKTAWMRNFLG
jgi:phosphoenolpyruvate carboxylase